MEQQFDLGFGEEIVLVAGVDEVGRGPLAGPVVTAAVILDPARPIEGLADSKKLSERKREQLAEIIKERALAWSLGLDGWREEWLIAGLVVFGAVFAINSAVHSYLILAYAEHDKVAMNVGFYYMANAGGRLAGTVLSGWAYQSQGLEGCLWWSSGFLLAAGLLSLALPEPAGSAEKPA